MNKLKNIISKINCRLNTKRHQKDIELFLTAMNKYRDKQSDDRQAKQNNINAYIELTSKYKNYGKPNCYNSTLTSKYFN